MTVIYGKWQPADETGPYVFEIAFDLSEGFHADGFLDLPKRNSTAKRRL
jgi:hypothetical protein